MRRVLEEFESTCNAYGASIPASGYVGDKALRDRAYALEHTVKTILRAIEPELADFSTTTLSWHHEAAGNARRGIGILDHADELAAMLRTEGPALPANELHPWVWDAAQTFWEAGEHAVAAEQAAKSITAHTRSKTGSKLSDLDLQAQVWSDDSPAANKPRLRLPGDRSTDTWQSRQRGAKFFAMGCYAGIRNPAAHEHDPDWGEQVALEYLAALSVLARWIDEAEVEAVK